MSLILIHPDFQKGSSLCPVCNAREGKIRRYGLRLCFDCNKDAIIQDSIHGMMRDQRAGSPARSALLLAYGVTVMLMDIGYCMNNLFSIIRDAVKGWGRPAPEGRLKDYPGPVLVDEVCTGIKYKNQSRACRHAAGKIREQSSIRA